MPKIVIHLKETEYSGLVNLSEQTARDPKIQAYIILINELERLGFIKRVVNDENE